MFKNYVKIAFKNLLKYRMFSFINMLGLAIGMACSILILLWILDELSYDRFHENSDQIQWVVRKYNNPDGSIDYSPVTPMPLAGALKSEYPEITDVTRFSDGFGEFAVKSKEKVIYTKGSPIDLAFFNIFTFPFVYGDKTTALRNSNSIVITEDMAKKLYGTENPVGKNLQFELWGGWHDFYVTSVLKDIPKNSHFQFDFLFSISFLERCGWDANDWLNGCVKTYILTKPEVSITQLNNKIADINTRHHSQANGVVQIQPLTKIHLYDLKGGGRIVYIYVYSIIALFILVIACINFINLSTARSENRAKEVGIRKVFGAHRRQIILQFLAESVLFSFLALLISLLFIDLTLPAFNRLTTKELEFPYYSYIFLCSLGIALFTGLISGIYPSIIFSLLNATNVIKGIKVRYTFNRLPSLRKVLVTYQFIVSIILIIGVITVHDQLSYMNNRSLGYDKENIIRIDLRLGLRDPIRYKMIKQELLKNSSVLSLTACNSNFSNWQFMVDENDISWEGKLPNHKISMELNSADYDYIKTFNMKMAQGRFFSEDFPTDLQETIVLNETAVKAIGMKNPIGRQFQYRGNRRIIGVVKDFNFYSLHRKVEPLILFVDPFRFHSLYIKIRGVEIFDTIQFIKQKIQQTVPDYPFTFSFLDEKLNQLYGSEKKLGKILTIFSLLAIFIACLGLFGLVSYTTEQKTKEIGIRKVLGATVSGIVVLLSKDFIKWILIANIIAWPVAYYAMNKWLENFAYRINIGFWTFLLAGTLALVIALLTVSYQAIRAATANPVEALRYE